MIFLSIRVGKKGKITKIIFPLIWHIKKSKLGERKRGENTMCAESERKRWSSARKKAQKRFFSILSSCRLLLLLFISLTFSSSSPFYDAKGKKGFCCLESLVGQEKKSFLFPNSSFSPHTIGSMEKCYNTF